jgi:hypothetical protein
MDVRSAVPTGNRSISSSTYPALTRWANECRPFWALYFPIRRAAYLDLSFADGGGAAEGVDVPEENVLAEILYADLSLFFGSLLA